MRNFLIILILTITTATLPAYAQKAEQKSVKEALDENGLIKPGVEGSFDASGYKMEYGPNGEPKFLSTNGYWQEIGGTQPAFNNLVRVVFVYGGKTYIGGSFTDAGGNPNADRIVVWDGGTWTALGTGISNGIVYTIRLKGMNVYAGGTFTDAGGITSADYIAKWNGSAWEGLGSITGGYVYAIDTAMGGSDLYVGGSFTQAGGISNTRFIAKLSGTTWSAMGTGITGSGLRVNAIANNTTAVYVGGDFTQAGGIDSTARIAKFSSGTWSKLGSAIQSGEVHTIKLLSSNVYVGGYFQNAGGNPNADYIAYWNGSAWQSLSSGLPSGSTVRTISVLTTSNIYIGGYFLNAGASSNANHIAKWNGTGWVAVGNSLNQEVYSIHAVSDNDVRIGGIFTDAGSTQNADYLTKWNGSGWLACGAGLNNTVNAVGVSGSNIYAGGNFTDAGGNANADKLAYWNGSSWQSAGNSALDGNVFAIAISGSNIYVGGDFNNAGGNSNADKIALWNGSTWQSLGTSPFNGAVMSLAVSGTDVYAGGDFTSIGGSAINRIAKWNGSGWSALGSGLNSSVLAIAVNGTDVYAGGVFTDAGGNGNADYIAKWNGGSWESLGSTPLNNFVYALAFSDNKVYAGGSFTDAGSNGYCDKIAVWTGSEWQPLYQGLNNNVSGITISGTNVYVTGYFTAAGGNTSANGIARWDGTTWHEMAGFSGTGMDIAIKGYDVFVGGGGITLSNTINEGIARWHNIVNEPAAQPTSLTITNRTTSGMSVSFVGASGGASGYIALRKSGSSSSAAPSDETAYTVGSVIGDAVVVYVGSGTSFSQTGLSANTQYYYSIFSFNGTGEALNYLTSSPLSGNAWTLANEPSAPPTNIAFSNPSASSMTVTYTAASGSPSGYIFLKKAGSAPTGIPTDGQSYSAGQVIGSDTVVYIGSSTSFNAIGLQANTVYYYAGYSYNGSGASTNYRTSDPLTGSRTTLQNEPSAPPTGLTFSNLAPNSYTLNFTAATGSPSGYIFLRRSGSAPTGIPADGQSYSSGNGIGTDTVVYVGSSTAFNQIGLTANTNYYYAGYSYNGSGSATNYLTTSALTGNRTTLQTEPTAPPTNFAYSIPTTSSFTISYTAAAGSPTGYLVIRKAGSSPSGTPVDGQAYTAGQLINGDSVVYVGSGTSFAQNGLISYTQYFFDVFSYNGTGGATNYRTVSPLEGSATTLTTEPTYQPANLVFSEPTPSSYNLSFTYAIGSPSGYLFVRRAGSAPTGIPADGQAYTSGQVIGTDTVVYVGAANGFAQTGLTANTIYYYKGYSYNGSGVTTNYKTTDPLAGSRSTLQTEPTAQPTNFAYSIPTTSSFTISYTAATGSPTGYLVIRKAGSSPSGTPVDGQAYTVGQLINGDSVVYVGSGTTFNQSGLFSSTSYYFDIFSYKGSGEATNYRITSPLEGTASTLIGAPIAQPTNMVFSGLSTNSYNISYTYAIGNPNGYLFVRRAGSAPTAVPADGQTYTAGQVIGTDTVVYAGAANAFTQNGLQTNTVYHYAGFSYNGSGSMTDYLTTSPLTGSRSTLQTEPTAQPTNIQLTNITAYSMTVSFTAASGSPTGYLVIRKSSSSSSNVPSDGQVYTTGQTIGGDSVVFIGSGTTFNQTGLSSNTAYYFDVFAYRGTGEAINYRTVSPLEGNATTLLVEPSYQPTNPVFSNITGSSMTLSYTMANGNPNGYIFFMRAGSAPTEVPVDGQVYTIGQTVGSDIVAYAGSSTSFNQSGLAANTVYYFTGFSYNGSGVNTNYMSTGPMQASQTTYTAEPTAQPTNLLFTDLTAASFTVSFTAAAGSPAGYLVIRKAGSSPITAPSDGTEYTAGQTIGGDSVVYVGSGTSFSQLALLPNTQYFYDVYAYNGSGTVINYLTASPLEGQQFTGSNEPTAAPTNLVFSNVGSTALTATFTAAAGNPTGYIAIRRAGSAPASQPADGVVYSAGQTIGDGIVAFVGSGTSFNDNSLPAASAVYFTIYSYNGTGNQTNYLTSSTLTGNAVTLAGQPANQATNLNFSGIMFSSLTISFTAAADNPDGYLILRKAGSAPTAVPADANVYIPGTVFGDAMVIRSGSGISLSDTGLISGSDYHYTVYSFNGSGASINYLTPNPLTGNQTTLQDLLAPEITGPTSSPNPANADQLVTITVTVTDNNAVSTVRMDYRTGTATAYGNQQAMTGSGNIYSADIPGTSVSTNGLFYRIIASDVQGNADTLMGTVPVIISANTVSTQSTTGSAYESGFPDGNWRMFSVPLKLDDGSVAAVLAGFGSPGNKTWRLFSGSTDVSTSAMFVLGKSFWLKQIHIPGGKQVTLGSGATASAADGRITLVPGWNQIANPFTFPVDWALDTDAPDNVNIKGPIAYDGSKFIGIGQNAGDNTPFTTLKSWDGYWVYNASSANQVLTIDPSGVYSVKAIMRKFSAMNGWRLQVIVKNGRYEDQYNYVGAAADAGTGEDRYDLPELPLIEDYVSVTFDHLSGDKKVPYTIEFQPAGEEGYIWDMSVRTDLSGNNILSWIPEQLPSGFVVRIMDVNHHEMVENQGYQFKSGNNDQPVKFRIWAGTENFVAESMARFENELPRSFALYQNYPNPFNPNTTIKFDIAKSGNVKLQVYNVLGQLVATLANRYFETGKYDLQWNGKDAHGKSVSNGIYIIRMTTDGYVKARKMALVR